ncbi:hypothetical protein KC349_g76 [Hortaea werneckii]|nr:hypothetical protein KC349_g76 [Hortaea werneckii]
MTIPSSSSSSSFSSRSGVRPSPSSSSSSSPKSTATPWRSSMSAPSPVSSPISSSSSWASYHCEAVISTHLLRHICRNQVIDVLGRGSSWPVSQALYIQICLR